MSKGGSIIPVNSSEVNISRLFCQVSNIKPSGPGIQFCPGTVRRVILPAVGLICHCPSLVPGLGPIFSIPRWLHQYSDYAIHTMYGSVRLLMYYYNSSLIGESCSCDQCSQIREQGIGCIR